jgi:3-oxoacyl-[acyl-carrier protein] reductase
MLKGRVALVTGASRGIGRAIALKLARHGAAVIVNYRGSHQSAQEVVREIEAFGGEAVALGADVSNGEEVKKMIAEIKERFGRLDILVNNAGINEDSLLLRMKSENWEKVINTNLTGTFNCTREALKLILKSDSGSIINISSVVGQIGNAGQCNYAAAKAGIIGFTRSLAREMAGRNVRVNAVAPGFIDTDMTAKLSQEVREKTPGADSHGETGVSRRCGQCCSFFSPTFIRIHNRTNDKC